MTNPAPLLPPELIDQPLSRSELVELFGWIDTVAEDSAVAPAEFAADVVRAEVLSPEEPEEGVHVPAGARWRITTDSEAEWAMRHLAEAEANRAAIVQQTADYIDRITSWSADALKQVDRDRAFFGNHLEAYAIGRRLAGGPATLTVPSGKVTTRDASPKAEVVDEEQVEAWADDALPAADYDVVVKTTRKVMVGELRKRVTVAEVAAEDRAVVEVACGNCYVSAAGAIPGLETFNCHEHGEEQVVSIEPEVELVVIDSAGERVPGMAVDPGGITAKATPAS